MRKVTLVVTNDNVEISCVWVKIVTVEKTFTRISKILKEGRKFYVY